MKIREIVQRLTREGWYLARQKGSHKIFKHPDKPELRIVIPDHGGSEEPSIGVLKDIKKKAGWE